MSIFRAICDLLFPPKCLFCRKVLRTGTGRVCPACAENLTARNTERTGKFFSRCVIPMGYEGRVREAIIRFKFQDQPGYATEFGGILARCVRENLNGEYDLITWIPVSEKRLKQRGYDQAMLLAMATALALEDVAVETLRKVADNPAQSSLTDAAERITNVQGAYAPVAPELVAGKRILLIDDIVTTGSTLDEASRTLLEAGASRVVAAALAQPVA